MCSKNTQCQLHLMHFYWNRHRRHVNSNKNNNKVKYQKPFGIEMMHRVHKKCNAKGTVVVVFFRTFFYWSTVREGYFFRHCLYALCNKIHAMCPTFMFMFIRWNHPFSMAAVEATSFFFFTTASQRTEQLSWFCLVVFSHLPLLFFHFNCVFFSCLHSLWNKKLT